MSQLLALMAGMLFIAHGQEGRAAIGTTTVLASGGHLTSHGSPENSIVFRPLQGGKGGRRQAAPPRLRFSASEMLG